MSVTDDIKRRLRRLKEVLDAEVPNHSYDSGFAIAARAGGIEDAIAIVEEVERDPKVRRIKLDGNSDLGSRKPKRGGDRKRDQRQGPPADEGT